VLDAEPGAARHLSLAVSAAVSGVGAESLVAAFRDFGADAVDLVHLGAPPAQARLDLLESATGLFLAGSGPSWLPLPDGPWSEALRRRGGEGLVVGGSGAGAALLAERCLSPASGASAGGRRRAPGLVPGLGLLPGLLLDPQLRQRDRLGRLLGGLAVDPTLLALGIDEDTAVIVDPDEQTLEVRGIGAVLVIDALESASFPAPRTADPRPMLGLRVDLLTAGCRYDLRERRAHPGTVHGTGRRILPVPAKPQGE
jgi:cyanophycinase